MVYLDHLIIIIEKILIGYLTNPVAKEVRTSKFKSQVVEDKTKYNRKKQKTLHEELMEGFEQEKKIREEEDE
jgi:hypothetical protein